MVFFNIIINKYNADDYKYGAIFNIMLSRTSWWSVN